MRVTVIDDVLDEPNRDAVVQHFIGLRPGSGPQWAEGTYQQLLNYGSPLSKLLSEVATVFDLKEMVGCEYWSHFNAKTGWHKDTDENLFYGQNVESFPICSVVYYPYIHNLTGGDLLFETMRITPRVNRLVVFGPGLLHNVEDFSGDRLSIAINPWRYKLELRC